MTATLSIDSDVFLHEELAQASPDLMRELLLTFVNALLSAQADSVCGAEYGARSETRSNCRNGYRHRDLDTRAGTIDVAIPKLREGSFFPDWLLERHRRAEAALTTVVATCSTCLGCLRLPNGDLRIRRADLDAWLDDHAESA